MHIDNWCVILNQFLTLLQNGYSYRDCNLTASKEKFNKIIRFGTTETEAMVAMLLALIEEGIYNTAL